MNRTLRLVRIGAALAPRAFAALPACILRRSGAPLGAALAGGFERLGPAFVKLGQFLSVRPDLVGAPFARAMEHLRDAARPMEPGAVEEVILRELKRPALELFAHFDPIPVACASVSQVHRAVTFAGEEVALKIQRPEAEELLGADLALFRAFAALLAKLPALSRHVDLPGLAEEIAESARRETDFRLEAEVCERFAVNFLGEPGVRIPRIHWGFTTRRILAAEYVRGSSIADPARPRGEGYRDLAERGSRYFFAQLLEHGLFHADLHPANVFITEDGRIAYLDFGIWGELDGEEREAVVATLAALLLREGRAALEHLTRLGVRVPPGRESSFVADVGEVLRGGFGPDLAGTDVARMGVGILKAVRRNRVALPHKYALLIKALLTVEGAARLLHPGFDMEGAARAYLAERIVPRMGVTRALDLLWRAALAQEAPERLKNNAG